MPRLRRIPHALILLFYSLFVAFLIGIASVKLSQREAEPSQCRTGTENQRFLCGTFKLTVLSILTN